MNRSFILALSLLALTACSGSKTDEGAPQPNVAIPSQPNALQYSTGVPAAQSAALNETISSLYVLPISKSNSEAYALSRVMKTRDLTPEGLQSWMQARVQYIIEQGFDIGQHAVASNDAYPYQNPSTLPDGFSNRARVGESEAQVMMANIGAWIYAKGKTLKVLIGLEIPGIGTISMSSPRTGLLQIGDGLFTEYPVKTQNIVADIFRAGVLFHEARHSDGNGHTLGFMHAICPRGPYKGKSACDYSTNGPYTVGASLMKALMNECRETSVCTARSKDILKALYLDQSSRTIESKNAGSKLSKDAAAGVDWNDDPEGVR
jgi:hypothetical protein